MFNPHRDTDGRHSGTHADGTVPRMVSAGMLIGNNVYNRNGVSRGIKTT
jgi:hypothetical protein